MLQCVLLSAVLSIGQAGPLAQGVPLAPSVTALPGATPAGAPAAEAPRGAPQVLELPTGNYCAPDLPTPTPQPAQGTGGRLAASSPDETASAAGQPPAPEVQAQAPQPMAAPPALLPATPPAPSPGVLPAPDFLSLTAAVAQQPPAAEAQAQAPQPVTVPAPLLPTPTPPAAPAAAPTAPATPTPRWLLMKELQGTWPGVLMDTERVSIYGWTQGSVNMSSDRDINAPMSFDDQARKFLVQQAWIRLDRAVVTTGTTEPTYGGRVDLYYGTDYRYTLPQRGLFFEERFEKHTPQGDFPLLYGPELVQFYGEAYYPTVARGLDVKVGRFYTPYGVESIEAVSTPMISHSYIFSNGSPFTHTGVLATLTLTPVWTVQAGIVLGSDVVFSEADQPTFVGSVQWTQPGGRNVVKATTVFGSGRFEQDLQFNNINIFDVVWTHLFSNPTNNYSTFHPEWTMPIPSPGLSYQLEALVGYQTNTTLPDGTIGSATWGGVAHYLNYQFTPRLAGTTRLEFFDDNSGQRTGFPGLYIEQAACLTFKPCPSFIIRPELRADYNEKSRAFENHKGLATATVDFIIRY